MKATLAVVHFLESHPFVKFLIVALWAIVLRVLAGLLVGAHESWSVRRGLPPSEE